MKINAKAILGLIIMITPLFVNGQSFSKIDLNKMVNKARVKYELPALSIVTMNADSIINFEIQGVRVHKTNNLVTRQDFFHIGSCSKSILAVIAAKLVEEEKIDWNTKFFDLYPELKNEAQKGYYNITLTDLFLCKAGLKPFTSADEPFPKFDSTITNLRYEFARWLVQQSPVSGPAEDGKFAHLYSNASYTMASLMLEKATAISYEELVKKYINEGMKIKTIIGFPNKQGQNQPWGHTIKKGKIEVFPPDHEYQIPHLLVPAGNLSLTPQEFSEYIRLNLAGLRGGDNYLSADSYQKIHFHQVGFSIGVFNGKMFQRTFSGMDGSAGTFFCRAIIIPEDNFAFVLMTNSGSGSGRMKAIDWLTMKILKKHYNWWWKFWL